MPGQSSHAKGFVLLAAGIQLNVSFEVEREMDVVVYSPPGAASAINSNSSSACGTSDNGSSGNGSNGAVLCSEPSPPSAPSGAITGTTDVLQAPAPSPPPAGVVIEKQWVKVNETCPAMMQTLPTTTQWAKSGTAETKVESRPEHYPGFAFDRGALCARLL